MTDDERLLLEVRSWMKDEQVAMPDAEQAGRRVAAKLSHTRQLRRRRWPLTILGRSPAPPTAGQTSTFQPHAIAAGNGQSPNVIGRTQTMFSPAKAIVAGALVLGIGGALLIAQPAAREGGAAPGATSDDPAMAPSFFTGNAPVTGACQLASPTVEFGDGVAHKRGESWGCLTWTTDDPRFSGASRNAWNVDDYTIGANTATGRSGSIVAGRERIENADGAWEGTWTQLAVESFDQMSGWFVGEGAYEGLTAYVVVSDTGGDATVRGLIMPGGPLAPPDDIPEE